MQRQLAEEDARALGQEDFKASEGWLSRLKDRHGISAKAVSGEAKSVNVLTVENWKEELREIIKCYKGEDIYNTDEMGLFFKTCSKKSLMFQGDTAHGSKKFKDRVTLLLTCSWSGEKMKHTLIGKSEKPRALKRADMKRIPVHYRAQKSSWMTSQLFTDFLKYFDTEEGKKEQNRQVLLFMDNAGVHNSAVDNVPLKHTKVVFFPKTQRAVLNRSMQG